MTVQFSNSNGGRPGTARREHAQAVRQLGTVFFAQRVVPGPRCGCIGFAHSTRRSRRHRPPRRPPARAGGVAFAREGADVCIAYLDEHEDAKDTAKWVEQAGRKALLVRGDLADRAYCKDLVEQAAAGLGGIDVLANNAAHQRTFAKIDDLSDDEWDYTFDVNIGAMFRVSA